MSEKPPSFESTQASPGEREARFEETPEAREVRAEVEQLPEGEREKIGVGFRNVGFFVEEAKNNFFAKIFEWEAKSQLDEKSTVGRFVTSLGENFRRDANKARENIEAAEETSKGRKLSNAGYLFGNIIKYGRTVADLAGWTVAAPLRYAMMGGMLFSRGAEAAKEARLKNEEVIDKTRIADADKAAAEAWAIYESAKERAGDRPLSAKELEASYREGLPYDLLERLGAKSEDQPHLVNRMMQGVLKFHIGASVKRLDAKLEKIEGNKKLDERAKEAARGKLFRKYERRLRDYDRVVTQYGTVDALAMGGRYLELAGKAVVGAATVETLVLSLDRAWEGIAKLVEKEEVAEAVQKFGDVVPADTAATTADALVNQTAVADAIKANIPLDTLLRSGVTLDSLFAAGVSSDTVFQTVPLDTLLEAKVPVGTLLEKGVTPETLLAHGVSPDSLAEAGVDSSAVRAAVQELAPEVKIVSPEKALEKLLQHHPEFKSDTTWKVGESGLITREGAAGWYILDKKGDLYYSGGLDAHGTHIDPHVLRAGKPETEWEPTDELKVGKLEGQEELAPEVGKITSPETVASGKGMLGALFEKHPELSEAKGEWKVGESGLIVREGRPGWYLLDKKGDLWYSGGRTGDSVYDAQILKAGSTEWEVTREMAAPAAKEMMDEFGRVMAIEKGGSVWTAAQEMVKSGQISDEEFRAAWGNKASVFTTESQVEEHISKLGLTHEGDEVRFIPGEGGKAPRFEVIDVGEERVSTNEDLYDSYLQKGIKPPEWLHKAVWGEAALEVKAAASEVKLPSWLTERVADAEFAKTLPEKVTNLEHVRESFDEYSLTAQEKTIDALATVESDVARLVRDADLLGLSGEEREHLAEMREHIVGIKEAYAEGLEDFYDRIEDTGLKKEEYLEAIVKKGTRVKDIMAWKESDITPKFKGFVNFMKALRPSPGEMDVSVHQFLKSLPPDNFLLRFFMPRVGN